MISERHRFIYLQVPKTGGNSIFTALEPFSEDRRVAVKRHQDGVNRFGTRGPVTPHKHATLAEYAVVLGDGLVHYAVCISVRHPFERAVSFYFSPHRWWAQGSDPTALRTASWDRAEFLKMLETISPQTDFLTLDGHIRPPDHIIRYESLAPDFERFAKAVALPCSAADLPHVNASAGSPEVIRSILADKLLEREVAQRFSDDMTHFGYT